jgi:hypothetical protein
MIGLRRPTSNCWAASSMQTGGISLAGRKA